MMHCPICQARYAQDRTRLIEERPKVQLFHSQCATCGHGLFAYVMESVGGLVSVGMVTDAAGEDAVRIGQRPVVTSRECLSAHHLVFKESRAFCRALLDISGGIA